MDEANVWFMTLENEAMFVDVEIRFDDLFISVSAVRPRADTVQTFCCSSHSACAIHQRKVHRGGSTSSLEEGGKAIS